MTNSNQMYQGNKRIYGGDTTKLSKALEGVNKTIKGTQTELKDAIQATKEKLATLR